MNVIEALQAELNETNAKLQALDQLKNDRATLVAQSARLTKAIAMVSGEPIVRKPMSPEARERIRAGLEKARAAKLAAGTPKPQPIATPAQPTDGGKKLPATEKGSGRGAN
jgi:hypothetical protein